MARQWRRSVPSDDNIVAQIVAAPRRREALQAVAALALPDAWLAAGALREPIWDQAHGYPTSAPQADLDVVYYDPHDTSQAAEVDLEARLCQAMPGLDWSVRNQARMHQRNGDQPYRSTADALCHWLETPTAIGLRLDAQGRPELLAPFGLDDLLALRIRPTPHAKRYRREAYRARLLAKAWERRWPRLEIEYL